MFHQSLLHIWDFSDPDLYIQHGWISNCCNSNNLSWYFKNNRRRIKSSIFHYLLKLKRVKFEQMIVPLLSSSEHTFTYIRHLVHNHDLKHVRKTIVFNDLLFNILITVSLFTTSSIKWHWHLYFIAYSNWSAVKPFEPVQFLLMIFVCFMSAGIISETSPHHCVSNGATLRKEYALHVLSHQICKYSLAEKNTYTYLGCLANLYTFFNQKIIRNQAFFYI